MTVVVSCKCRYGLAYGHIASLFRSYRKNRSCFRKEAQLGILRLLRYEARRVAAVSIASFIASGPRAGLVAVGVAAVVPALWLAFLPAVAAAGTIGVPGDVPTIELALVLASPGDTVLVSPGTYYVNLEWPDKEGLKLLAEEGPAQTILDGSGDVQVIGVYTGVDTTTVISGFTIRNGHAEGQ